MMDAEARQEQSGASTFMYCGSTVRARRASARACFGLATAEARCAAVRPQHCAAGLVAEGLRVGIFGILQHKPRHSAVMCLAETKLLHAGMWMAEALRQRNKRCMPTMTAMTSRCDSHYACST